MRDYSTHKLPRSLGTNIKPVIFGVFIVLTIIYFITNYLPKLSSPNIKPDPSVYPSPSEKKKEPLIKNNISSQKELIAKVQDIAKNTGGTSSVYIYDINKKQGFGINENMVLTAASVNKVAILAALYYLAGREEIDLEKEIILQQKDIQDYGTGSIRYDLPGTPYSLKTLARLMMEKSDNTAAYILGTLTLGLDKIQQLVTSWGLTQTNLADNKTSVKDMSILLSKMYKEEITTKPLTSEMLDFMDKSDFEDRIPAGIDEGIKVYHKTGDEIGKIHDVGIIDLPGKPYYIGIMTTDMTDDENTKKALAQISSLVFSYMKNL